MIKRIDGKAGKWISVKKALPSTNEIVIVCIEFPNRSTIYAFGKLHRDFWEITGLAEVNDYLSPNGARLDLTDSKIQEDLNRFVQHWQKIDAP